MRITNANQLRRGMVLTLWCLSHPNIEGIVVTEVLSDGFRAARLTANTPGCRRHHDSPYHFLDHQIISTATPSIANYAIWWAESTGEKTEEEVQQMLADDCLHVT